MRKHAKRYFCTMMAQSLKPKATYQILPVFDLLHPATWLAGLPLHESHADSVAAAAAAEAAGSREASRDAAVLKVGVLDAAIECAASPAIAQASRNPMPDGKWKRTSRETS